MRFLSYNIHGCVGRGRRKRPEDIIEVIRQADADVVALQEVHDETRADRSFLRHLADDLDYPHFIHGPTMRKREADYGNLMLLKTQPLESRRIDISHDGREPRGAILARLATTTHPLEIVATHLGLRPAERRSQVAAIAAALDPDPPPDLVRVLMGDLNEWWPFGGTARRIVREFGEAPTLPSFPACWPLFALDRIHVRPATLRVRHSTVDGPLARRASDHRPLLAEVDLGQPKTQQPRPQGPGL